MEDGLFQSQLSHLEIEEEFQVQKLLPPDQVPEPVRDIQLLSNEPRSKVVEALISQNEDLMSRLKVNLRRLLLIEDENSKLTVLAKKAEVESASISDQISVWKEKEKMWQLRAADLELQAASFKKRFPEYEKMEERLHRYEKYQEKIRTQVKPYIQQLKSYSEQLGGQIRTLNLEIDEKESQYRKLQRDYDQKDIYWATEMNRQKEKLAQVTLSFESEMSELQNKLETLRVQNYSYSEQLKQLEFVMAKSDELQNQMIAHKRRNEDLLKKQDEDSARFQAEIRKANETIVGQKLNLEHLTDQKMKIEQKAQELAKERADLDEKLESLRFLWGDKSQENEKMKLSLQSLEKINRDLSRKLNDLRIEQSPART